ncbi:MAG TPA: VWA domain-containing protein [Bryobacteraceae bacterium]
MMSAKHARPVILWAILGLAAGAARAQSSNVIQTETREVLIDAVVTGNGDAYIRDLTAKDFHVSQDGREQAIKGFTFAPASVGGQQRSMVLFFDQTSIEPQDMVLVRQAANSFIDAEAGANHMMAIVAFDGTVRMVQSFTNNAGRLKEGVTQASTLGFVSGSNTGASRDAARGADQTFGRPADRSGGNASANSIKARDMIRSLGSLGKSLGSLPGRKIVILFGGALVFNGDQRSEIRETVDAANRSGVAFYPMDVRPVLSQTNANVAAPNSVAGNTRRSRDGLSGAPQGDTGDFPTPILDTGTQAQQVFFGIANGTGGFVVTNTSDLLGALQRIEQEQNTYYTLTYTAPEAKEGSCHAIKVTVERKGAKVRARSSYCTAKPLDLLAGTAAAKELDKRAASAQSGGIAASIQLPYFYAAPNVARVNVVMEIKPDTLKLDAKKSKQHIDMNFLGIATTPDGDVRARFSDTLKLDIDDSSAAERLKAKPLHYEKEFKIAPGNYTLTLAFNQGEADFGKLQIPLTVEPWSGDFAMSGIALSRETHPAGDLGLGLGLEDRTPLITDNVQVVPTGSARFEKSEVAYFYFEVYGSDAQSAKVRIRIVDLKTGDQKWDGGFMGLPAPAAAGSKSVPAGARLPLDSLPVGSYQLEITAADAAGKQLKRTAGFEVVAR